MTSLLGLLCQAVVFPLLSWQLPEPRGKTLVSGQYWKEEVMVHSRDKNLLCFSLLALFSSVCPSDSWDLWSETLGTQELTFQTSAP